ncbi:MAG: DUF296 domain-containing protein [Armatimonadetes bacterium]|nr:DUF296 domain-containing protein [Candidatus Hippobium faecium]
MKYTQGFMGRVFVARLDDGESLKDSIENICIREGMRDAIVYLVGGLRDELREGKLVGLGLVVPKNNKPNFLFHASIGNKEHSFLGQSDSSVVADTIVEAIVVELGGIDAMRLFDEKLGCDALTIVGPGSDGKQDTQMKGAFSMGNYK